MEQLLQGFILLPLLAFIVSMLIPRKYEKIISALSITTTSVYLAGAGIFIFYWILNEFPVLDIKHIVLFKNDSFEFFIDFYFDSVTAVYSFIGGTICLLVAVFSKFYMHREPGFKRFFCTLLLFFLGYNLVIFSGNFETLFIGWEIMGFCSFALVAFYRDRYLPVKNALKVISVYRLGDVCLMLALWMCHYIFHENITFNKLHDTAYISQLQVAHLNWFIFASIMILIAAAAKSAVLPFSSWLPRAMEGPTTSSAIFYGSLSVHLGAFLLLRTYPFWENIMGIKIGIIILGVLTTIIASSIARVQSTVKTQIAYSSITQIGLIFIEVALGFHMLALIHFAGNAFLRTYQLLVSPSVLNYQIHNMFFNFAPKQNGKQGKLVQKISNSFYILGIKEWNLDWFMYRFLWSPFKWTGRNMRFLLKGFSIVVLSIFFLVGLSSFISKDILPDQLDIPLTFLFAFIGLMMILTAFSDRGDARKTWLCLVGGQCFLTLSIAFNELVPLREIMIYISGVGISGLVGYACLNKIHRIDNDIILNKFHGYVYEKPRNAFLFLISCLGLIGFPITPVFLGIDLLYTHINPDQILLLVITSLSFIFIELTALRIYSRVYLGQHKKNNHPIAFRSS